MLKITKKEFKELASIHVYGKGQDKITALFFDWLENDQGRGFKYMYGARGYTKKDILNEAYDFITKDYNPWWAIVKIAQTDKDRFRVPISM